MGPAHLRMHGVSLGVTGALGAEAVVHRVGGLIGPVGTIRWRVMTPAAGFMTADPAAVVPTNEAARVAVARAGVAVPQGPRKVACGRW